MLLYLAVPAVGRHDGIGAASVVEVVGGQAVGAADAADAANATSGLLGWTVALDGFADDQ